MLRQVLASVALALVVSVAALPSAVALAQPTASELALAREQFRNGVQAARAERWTEAREMLQRSFELAPRPLTLLNLAGALVQTGRLVEGAEAYRRFLREVHSGRAARQRDAAREALQAVQARIAFLRIRAQRLIEGDSVAVDGVAVPEAALEVDFPVDPGERRVEIVRDGSPVAQRTVTLDEAEHREVTLRAPPRPRRVARQARRQQRRGSLWTSPWLWIAAGAVAAGTVTAIVVASSGTDEAPYSGNVGTWRVR